jgi:hypothetical protein
MTLTTEKRQIEIKENHIELHELSFNEETKSYYHKVFTNNYCVEFICDKWYIDNEVIKVDDYKKIIL